MQLTWGGNTRERHTGLQTMLAGGGQPGSIYDKTSESIRSNACRYNDGLLAIEMNNVVTIGIEAFDGCISLSAVSFPKCERVDLFAFQSCYALTAVDFPACSYMGQATFESCFALAVARFPVCTAIGINAFEGCRNLVSLYLTSVSRVTTLGRNAFYSTPIAGYSASAGRYGSVFVPSSLYSQFIVATNWTSISSRIVAV